MKIPNKTVNFKESIFYKGFQIMEILDKEKRMNINTIYETLKGKMKLIEFIEALEVLNCLKKIEIDNDGSIYIC